MCKLICRTGGFYPNIIKYLGTDIDMVYLTEEHID